jgi:hypothetical protein
MVLKSGARRPVSYMSSTLRCASRFALQALTGLDTVDIAIDIDIDIDIELEQKPRGGRQGGQWPQH